MMVVFGIISIKNKIKMALLINKELLNLLHISLEMFTENIKENK